MPIRTNQRRSPKSANIGDSPNGLSQDWIVKITPNGGISDVLSGSFRASGLVFQVPVITSPGVARGMVGVPFNYAITSDNAPTSFSAPGLLDSMSLDTAAGVISGRPTQTGTFAVAISATGAAGTARATLTVTIDPSPGNQAPTLAPIATQLVNEDSGTSIVNLTGITAGATYESQVLKVTAASGDTNLIQITTVDYTSPNTAATLAFTTRPNASGTNFVTVVVIDDDTYGAGTALRTTNTFVVEVVPVNDAPAITAPATAAATEDIPIVFGGTNTMALSDADMGTAVVAVTSGTGRTLRVVNGTGFPGGTAVVPIELLAEGNENALGFSVAFDPAALSFDGATLGTGPAARF